MTYNINIDTIEPNLKTLSIKIDGWYIDEQGQLQLIKERRAFLPGQIDEVNSWLDKFAPGTDKTQTLNVLNVMWPQEVINTYRNAISE